MKVDTLDSNIQNIFSRNYILRRERIYGQGWISVGGELTTRGLSRYLHLHPGQKVLDVGSGIGGAAFFLACQYAANVIGVDLSSLAVTIANERLKKQDEITNKRVKFLEGDVKDFEFKEGSFNAVHSREVFIYNENKEEIFKKMHRWLKEDGHLLITDLCYGSCQNHSEEFKEYIGQFDYHPITVERYKEVLQKAGFREICALDKGKEFVQIMKRELRDFLPCKEAFIMDFSEEEFNSLVHRWERKIAQTQAGELSWVEVRARK